MNSNVQRRNAFRAFRSNLSYQQLEKRCLLAALGNGEEIIDDIEVGQLVEYDFQVDAAGAVHIAMAKEAGSSSARTLIEVYDSVGNLVQSDGDMDSTESLVTFDAPQADQYRLVFGEVGNDHAMTFRARAASFSSEIMLIEGRDEVLRNGIEEDAAAPSGLFSVFPLEVPDSGMVRISTSDNSSVGGRAADLILYDADGQRIETIDARLGEDSTVEFNSSEAQTVTAVVFEASNADSIRAVVLPGELQFDRASTDGFLGNGEEETRLLIKGKFSLLHFVANQADQVRFTVSDHIQNGSPILKVYRSDGTLVGSDFQDGTHATVKFTAAESGVFTAIVSDLGADTTMSFRARMAIVQGAAQLIALDAILESGVEVLTATPKLGFRIFPINVASAGQVNFELNGITASSFALLEVYDSDGNLVASGGSQNAPQFEIDFTASAAGTYTAFVSALSLSSGTIDGSMGFTIEANFNEGSFVVGRQAYYNNSFFDEDTTFYFSKDDDAAALGKRALLPGQAATFANYTNYEKGINGIFIDVAGLADSNQISADDIVLRTGNGSNASDFNLLNVAPTVGFRSDVGNGESDRIAVILPDHSVTNEWLQVTLLANATTGLAVDDQFYFGNSVGDVFNSFDSARVNLLDVGRVRGNQSVFSTVDIENFYDIDRDGRVNLVDVGLTRVNQSGFSGLNLITAPDGTGNRTWTGESKSDFGSVSLGPIHSRLNPYFDDLHDQIRWINTLSDKPEARPANSIDSTPDLGMLAHSLTAASNNLSLTAIRSKSGFQPDPSSTHFKIDSTMTDDFFSKFREFESSLV